MAKWTSRQSIRQYAKDAYTKAMGEYVADLAVLGYEAIMYAYQQRGFQHKTRNLHDSYASAVYVNGKLEESSIRFVGPEISHKGDRQTGKSGRETVMEYLRSPGVGVGGDITLLCVAAMEYAKYLEDGTHKGGYHIQVISSAYDYIQSEWRRVEMNKPKEFKVVRARMITGGDYSI